MGSTPQSSQPGKSVNSVRSTKYVTKKLPRDPSVEHLRKQAKALHRQYQQNLQVASRRVEAVFTDKHIRLTDAQHIIAVEYGFLSWQKMTAHIESVTGTTIDWKRDEKDNLPKAANDGDWDRFQSLLEQGDFTQHDLDLALARCWGWGGREELALRIAQALIDAGADPNGEYGGNYGPILLAACEGQNLTAIRFLLDHGADAVADPDRETKYPTGNTPMRMLLGSYIRGRVDQKHAAIDLLKAHGATRPPEIDDIAFAIFRDDFQTLADLIDADPQRIAHRFTYFPWGNIGLNGGTYLHQAVEFEAVKCVDVLCSRGYEYGIHINTRSEPVALKPGTKMYGNQTPIFHAVASNGGGNFPMFRHLLNRYGQWIDFTLRATFSSMYGGDPMTDEVTPLEWAEACAKGDTSYWKTKDVELAELRSRDVRWAMIDAVRRGDADAANVMMDEHREHVGSHLWPPAIFEAQSLAMTQSLLDRGVSPDKCSAPRKPLHLATSRGSIEIIEVLLQHSADPNVVDGEHVTPIELTAGAISGERSANHDVIVDALRKAGATITPFTHMLLREEDEVIAAFENDRSLLDQTGWLHFPPMICAARAGCPRVVAKLLELGVDPDAGVPGEMNSPLWFACQAMTDRPDQQVVLIQTLIDAGAEVNKLCEEGTTALHFAVFRGHLAIIELLLINGADTSIVDDRGETAMDWVERTKQPEHRESMLKLLLKS